VVIAPSTRRMTGGLFDYADLGPVEINGLTSAGRDRPPFQGPDNLDTRIVTVDDTRSHVFISRKEARQYQIKVGGGAPS
jgi:hypothetical protein